MIYKPNDPSSTLFESAIKVHQVRFKTPSISDVERIQEIKRNNPTNRGILKKNSGKFLLNKPSNVETKPQFKEAIKTVKIEMPSTLGTECAIVPSIRKPKKSIEKSMWTQSSVEKVEVKSEDKMDIGDFDSLGKTKSSFKNFPTLPIKAYKKKHDMTNKKVVSALATINQKLQKMQEKYFDKPAVIYRSVNDCFTQSSKVEVLYENDKFPEKVEETLKDIEKQLDTIAKINLDDSGVNVIKSPTKFSENSIKHDNNNINKVEVEPKKSNDMSYSDIVDSSISKLNKFKAMRQKIVDVENVCKQLTNITKEESSGSEPDVVKKEDKDTDTKKTTDELEQKIKKSDYLMREFNVKPCGVIFRDLNASRRRRRLPLDPFNDTVDTRKQIADIMNDLNNSTMKNSLYEYISTK